MKKKTQYTISIIFIFLLVGTFLISCGSNNATPNVSSGGSTLDGQTLMQQRCSVCHSLDRVTTAHKSLDQWTVSVQRMIAHGAQLNSQEEQTLVAYLAATYK
jgi:mono/diheme cytochrome c family protein